MRTVAGWPKQDTVGGGNFGKVVGTDDWFADCSRVEELNPVFSRNTYKLGGYPGWYLDSPVGWVASNRDNKVEQRSR